jgi:hypothetical protein
MSVPNEEHFVFVHLFCDSSVELHVCPCLQPAKAKEIISDSTYVIWIKRLLSGYQLHYIPSTEFHVVQIHFHMRQTALWDQCLCHCPCFLLSLYYREKQWETEWPFAAWTSVSLYTRQIRWEKGIRKIKNAYIDTKSFERKRKQFRACHGTF